jgi:DNA-binding NarL/FixJ family response regulator
MTSAPRVLLAESDEPTRVGLRLAMAAAGIRVVAELRTRAATVAAAAREPFDVALVATDLPGGGIEAVRDLNERLPATKIIVLTADPHGGELIAAVRAGAAGYLPKSISLERLPYVINGVLEGEVALPRRHTHQLLDELRARESERVRVSAAASSPLSDREWQVLALLGEGFSTVEMAQRLHISEVTVRRHISSLVGKLDVPGRSAAAAVLNRRAD